MRRHLAALSIPIALALASAMLLVLDFREGSDRGDSSQAALASVQSRRGDVRRKPQDRVVWFELKQAQPLFRRDSVRTVEGSSARIRFTDGSVVEIGQNSLIVIERSKDRISIDFVEGSLSVKTQSKGLAVKAGDISIDAASAELKISARKGAKDISVDVTSGTASVQSGDKGPITLSENQRGTLTEGGAAEIVDLPVKLLEPEPDAIALLSKESPDIRFRWEKSSAGAARDADGRSRLEIARDAEFERKVRSVDAPAAGSLPVSGLAPGDYFWRIIPEKRASSEVRFLHVLERGPVRLLEPQSGKPHEFFTEALSLPFQWTGPEYLEEFEIEFSDSANFGRISRKEPARDTRRIVLEWKDEGTFHWRVRGKSPRAGAGSGEELSDARSFSVRRIPDPAKDDSPVPPPQVPPPPVLAPEASQSKARIQLAWDTVTRAENYRLQISGTGEKPVLDKRTSAPGASFELKPGRYSYRIRSVNPLGTEGPWSAPHELLVAPPPPRSLQVGQTPVSAGASGSARRVDWEEPETASSYKVRVTEGNRVVLEKNVQHPPFWARSLAKGRYRISVASVTDGIPGPFGEPSDLEISDRAAPARVTPLFPRRDDALDGPELRFAWESLGQGMRYRVSVFRMFPETPGVPPVKVSETWVTVPEAALRLVPGRYSYRIQAASEAAKGPESEPVPFTVRGKSDAPAESGSPENRVPFL